MERKGITTMEVKEINKHNIYSFIYEKKNTSKQNIVDTLNISLSTVTHNIKLLEDAGLIQRSGFYQSTGGRKAYSIEIIRNAKITLGVGILKDEIYIVAVDLYGTVIQKSLYFLSFQADNQYYQNLGVLIDSFIKQGGWSCEQLLGTGIAIQGIPTADGSTISYGRILDHSGLKLEKLAQYISGKTSLYHDSKAAAFAELWDRVTIKSAIVLLLNHNFGGALILNRQIQLGDNIRAGLIEHMSIDKEGPLCYCGSRGCLETFCSASSLQNIAGCTLDTFFEQLRSDNLLMQKIWSKYLKNLAFAMRNLQVIMDYPIIVSGLLTKYMTPDDFFQLTNYIEQLSPFTFPKDFLLPGQHGPFAPAIGSALFLVDSWLKTV